MNRLYYSAYRFERNLSSNHGVGSIDHEKGQLGVKRAKQEFIDDGGIIYGEQMSIEVDGVRIRPDFIGYKDNVLHIYEVKNGPG